MHRTRRQRCRCWDRPPREGDVQWQSNFGGYFGNNAGALANTRLLDSFPHFVDDLLRLTIYVGAGPADWRFR